MARRAPAPPLISIHWKGTPPGSHHPDPAGSGGQPGANRRGEMSHTVRLVPSGHRFVVEADEPIVDAALRAGLDLAHGCAAGNCGGCKARVLSGQVRRVRSQDFAFSETEKAAGFILTCTHTASSDLVLEAQEAASAQDVPRQEIRCTVRKLEADDPGTMLLHLKTPRSQTLRFLAGQRVNLTTREGLSGELPVASCPCDGRSLLFLLHDRPDEPLLERLSGHTGAPQTLTLTGPQGDFLFDSEPSASLLFVALGLGVGPIKSMVEHALALDSAPRIDLYRTRSGSGRSYLDRLFCAWQDTLENFRYTPLPEDTSPAALAQRIASERCAEEPRDLYLAGPKGAIEALCARAEALGLSRGRMRSEIVD
jgi:CDP-4-dehydro-6-deoxyglucose reductase